MLRKILRSFTTRGVRKAIKTFMLELSLQRRHRSALRRVHPYLKQQDLKLHCGCGDKTKNGWVNIDLAPTADLQLDLREDLPFGGNSVSMIYSEHFFEHLDYPEEARRFLSESVRVLKPGGVFSVGVPDTEWPIRAYARDDDNYFGMARAYWHPEWCNTKMHHLNYHFRQTGEHKYAYDFETLSNLLSEVGFVSIERRPYDRNIDTMAWEMGTLYINARKPQ